MFLLVTDLDHTLVGNQQALGQLQDWLAVQRRERRVKWVYSTGRSLLSYRQLQAEQSLLTPDALIVAVGTEIYFDPHGDQADPMWSERLQQGWNRDAVVATAADFADLVPQPKPEQRLFKVSYFLTPEAAVQVIPALEQRLNQQQLACKLVYSSGRDLDILPQRADKGEAMAFVQRKWGFTAENTVVCGDSGNDIALFRQNRAKGIIVGNAQPELLQWHQMQAMGDRYLAQADCAAGIWEGLKYFGFC